MRTRSQEFRARLTPEERQTLERISKADGVSYADIFRRLLQGAAQKSLEQTAGGDIQKTAEEVTHLARRVEDLIAIVRGVEQALALRLDTAVQVTNSLSQRVVNFEPYLQPTYINSVRSALRLQAINDIHPNKVTIDKRFNELVAEHDKAAGA